MNEETKKLLHDYLTKILEGAERGADFVMEQAPEVAKEIVAYGRAVETAYVVGFLLAVLIPIAIAPWAIRKLRQIDNEAAGFAAFLMIPALLGTLSLFQCLSEFMKVWFAPRLYLIEYIKDLVK